MNRGTRLGILIVLLVLAAGCSFMNTFLNQDDINKAAAGPAATGGNSADTTPPQVSITSPTNNQKLSKTFTISGTCSDNVGVTKVTVYYYTNNGTTNSIEAALVTATAFSTNILPAALTYAPYHIYAEAQDAARNKGLSPAMNIIVADIPTVTFAAPAVDNGLWFTNKAAFSLGVNYSCTGYAVTDIILINYSNGSSVSNTQSFNPNNNSGIWNPPVNLTANATNIILAYAVSANGDASTLDSNMVYVDTIIPVYNLNTNTIAAYSHMLGTNFYFTNGADFPLKITETGSGMKSGYYSTNNSAFLPFSGSNIVLNNLNVNATNNIRWYGVDNAGNYSITNYQTLINDQIPPLFLLTGYDSVVNYEDQDYASFMGYAADGTGVSVFVEGGLASFDSSGTNWYSSIGFSGTVNYDISIDISAVDLAGNTVSTNVTVTYIGH